MGRTKGDRGELWGGAWGKGWSSGEQRGLEYVVWRRGDSRMKGRWSFNPAEQTHNKGEHVDMDTASSPVEGTNDSPVLVQTVYKGQL